MIVDRIASEFGVAPDFVARIIRRADYSYKTYSIPKKTGGERLISQPSRELKAIQRWVVRNLISALPVHGAATAYRDGQGIVDNAGMHAKSKYSVKIDFRDFFPSLTRNDVTKILTANLHLLQLKLSNEDIEVIASIVCRRGFLTIGAPSSPALSNALLFNFDSRVAEFCARRDLIYTRYADDITLSSSRPNRLEAALVHVREIIHKSESPKLVINEKKIHFSSRKYRRAITGLVVTPEGDLSIGRKAKRRLRHFLHQSSLGRLDKADLLSLRGYLAYVSNVEPQLIVSLVEKYGEEVIERINVADDSADE